MSLQILMAKAKRAVESAQMLMEAGDTDGACNRAYYAMFDAARAALLGTGSVAAVEDTRTHSGLIAFFSLHLVKTGRVSIDLGKALNRVEELRRIADYRGDAVELTDATWAVAQATAFVEAMQSMCSVRPCVTVIDYGMGNLLSVTKAFEHCGAEVVLAHTPEDILAAERLVLPGVGAFGDGMAELHQRKLVDAIRTYAASGKPLLGICLGMQMLMEGSDEFGATEGLGLVPGWVRKLPSQPGIKLPSIGWCPIRPPDGRDWQGTILSAVPTSHEMYFVHSFYADPTQPAHRLAETMYGDFTYSAAVKNTNVVGCQFHPEKSGEIGLCILRTFLSI